MMKNYWSTHLKIIIVLSVLAGCGGGGDGSDETPSTDSPPGTDTPVDPGTDTPPEEPTPPVDPGTDTPPVDPGTDTPPGDPITDGSVTKVLSGSLPDNLRSAAERFGIPHYVGSHRTGNGKNHVKKLPIRSYFAACATDTANPRMFVSLTLEDPTSAMDIKTVGSVFETRYDPATGALEPTGNQAVLPMCNESHGIAVSADCSRVALLCATEFEKPISETLPFTKDLTVGYSNIVQPNNIDAVNATHPDWTQEQREAAYLYHGEMWLLEWNGKSLSEDPEKYVIHKAFGGLPSAPVSLVYAEDDDTYAASFATGVFDPRGGRHKSGGLFVVDRRGWTLLTSSGGRSRGYDWNCGPGHVLHMRAFHNPYVGNDLSDHGKYGALCTTDSIRYFQIKRGGEVAIKLESTSSVTWGRSIHAVASSNTWVTNGGGHKLIPVNANKSLVVMAATNIIPENEMASYITEAEAFAASRGENFTGEAACNYHWDESCIRAFLYNFEEDHYPEKYEVEAFNNFFFGSLEKEDLTKIGLLAVAPDGRTLINGQRQAIKWIVEDPDCQLGDPQLVDLKNGRYLLGYAKFQCISDSLPLARHGGNHTLIPREYYIMEIDVDGNPLTAPTKIAGTGWGGLDDIVNLGPGRAAWAYIPNPELNADGSYTDPFQSQWELIVYESQLQ